MHCLLTIGVTNEHCVPRALLDTVRRPSSVHYNLEGRWSIQINQGLRKKRNDTIETTIPAQIRA
jgi:hypothetical protein